MPNATVNGTKLHYLQDGTGEDVVLVHGLASNLAFWYSGVMVSLRRKYRVLAYDLRGHGRSAMPQSGYTHYAMAEDLRALVDFLQIEKFHLIGHSYGGLISITFAFDYPQRLHSLTLADVPVDNSLSVVEAATVDGKERYPELALLEKLARKSIRPKNSQLPHAPFHHGKGAKKTAALWLNLLDTTTARQDFITRKILINELKNVEVPALLTYGLKSGWKDSAETLKESLPNNCMVYIQNAGHAHPWEKPVFFLNSWLEFVGTIAHHSAVEQRVDLRYKIEISVVLEAEDMGACNVETINISASGILVKSPIGYELGDTVRLSAIVDNNELKLSGHVVRQENQGDMYHLTIALDSDISGRDAFLGYMQEILNTIPSIQKDPAWGNRL